VIGTDRHCERCEDARHQAGPEPVVLQDHAYAEELLDFSSVEWPERTIVQQRNWIGKSLGVEFEWQVADPDNPSTRFAGTRAIRNPQSSESCRVFTTRPDTVFGRLSACWRRSIRWWSGSRRRSSVTSVAAYVEQTTRQTEIDRLSTERERTGIRTGANAINPMNGQRCRSTSRTTS